VSNSVMDTFAAPLLWLEAESDCEDEQARCQGHHPACTRCRGKFRHGLSAGLLAGTPLEPGSSAELVVQVLVGLTGGLG